MRYDRMRPFEIAAAIDGNWPMVLPVGVMEYHGAHLPAGVDMLAVTEALARLEVEHGHRMVILPPFAYGAASHAVAGAAGTGTLHVPSETLVPFAKALFAALLAVGFRNIHGVIHHQTENFGQGMPTDLAFRLAGRQAVFDRLEADFGPGWWGSESSSDYYAHHEAGENPFNWVRVHPLLPPGADYPFDHAGKGETGLMLALAPETVEAGRIGSDGHWFTRDAAEATPVLGERGVAIILAHLRQVLGLG